jgi:hypothetical protein
MVLSLARVAACRPDARIRAIRHSTAFPGAHPTAA